MLNKLERELWRTFHQSHRLHKADHFYNFCITALALKEHFFEWKGITAKSGKEPYYRVWSNVDELVAASEIANSAKHFVLRDSKTGGPKTTRTASLRPSRGTVVHVLTNDQGELRLVKDSRASSLTVEFEGNREFRLYEFMTEVVKYWRQFLTAEGVPLRAQTSLQLYGERRTTR
jgi:hypothetical protein